MTHFASWLAPWPKDVAAARVRVGWTSAAYLADNCQRTFGSEDTWDAQPSDDAPRARERDGKELDEDDRRVFARLAQARHARGVEEAEDHVASCGAGPADDPDFATADAVDVEGAGVSACDEDETGASGSDERAGARVQAGLVEEQGSKEEHLREAKAESVGLSRRKLKARRTKSIPLNCWNTFSATPSTVLPRTPGCQMSFIASSCDLLRAASCAGGTARSSRFSLSWSGATSESMTCFASSMRPFEMSQRGEYVTKGMPMASSVAVKVWMMNGTRQPIELGMLTVP